MENYERLALPDQDELLDLDAATTHARKASLLSLLSMGFLLLAMFVPGWGGFTNIEYTVISRPHARLRCELSRLAVTSLSAFPPDD